LDFLHEFFRIEKIGTIYVKKCFRLLTSIGLKVQLYFEKALPRAAAEVKKSKVNIRN